MKIQKLNEWVSPDNQKIVDDIISKLKSFDLDGETMLNILEKVGMDDQMLKQLVRENPTDALNEIIDLCGDFPSFNKKVLVKLDDFLLNNISNNSIFYEKIKEIILKIDAKKYNII